ncbi:TPA: cupin domain-containing protein [Serratia marcescens]|nr:cupin domain-containing protein [Serratia marcescens]HCR2997953.1 cupin domain-containing protein [Serratia marcescens]HCR3001052.1 cupin domain-containing protein [Serratia marcescens]HCR3017383.1 cupin domain-containing protein [Serratia marcescens]
MIFSTTVLAHGVEPQGQGETVKPNFSHAIPNIPGKSLTAVEVIYPAGATSASHTHAPSSFIYAYVVEGEIISQVEGQPERTYRAGESWYEDPGAHHVVSSNASKTKPAKLLAVFVVDTKDTQLTTPDSKP